MAKVKAARIGLLFDYIGEAQEEITVSYEGETIDISLGGMLVRVPRTFPLGAFVEISLHIPAASKPVVGLGSVTRSSQNEIGVQIDRLTIEESRRLQEFLLRLYVA